METIGQRVRFLRERRELEAKDLAERIGLSYSTLMDLENSRSKSTTKLPALVRELRTNSRFLETGKGDPDALEGGGLEPSWEDVLGYAQAVGLGDGPEAAEYAEAHKLKFRASSLSKKRLRPGSLAVFYGSGDSMLPRISPGDAVLFDTSDKAPRDGKLYVICLDGAGNHEYQVKRAMVLDETVYFVADNPAGDHTWIKPRKMTDERRPIEVIGRVRWIGSWED